MVGEAFWFVWFGIMCWNIGLGCWFEVIFVAISILILLIYSLI